MLNLNIQSLQAKYSSLQETLEIFAEKGFYFDIIGLQEVWNVKYPDLFPLNGYRPLVCKTRKNCQGKTYHHIKCSIMDKKHFYDYSLYCWSLGTNLSHKNNLKSSGPFTVAGLVD